MTQENAPQNHQEREEAAYTAQPEGRLAAIKRGARKLGALAGVTGVSVVGVATYEAAHAEPAGAQIHDTAGLVAPNSANRQASKAETLTGSQKLGEVLKDVTSGKRKAWMLDCAVAFYGPNPKDKFGIGLVPLYTNLDRGPTAASLDAGQVLLADVPLVVPGKDKNGKNDTFIIVRNPTFSEQFVTTVTETMDPENDVVISMNSMKDYHGGRVEFYGYKSSKCRKLPVSRYQNVILPKGENVFDDQGFVMRTSQFVTPGGEKYESGRQYFTDYVKSSVNGLRKVNVSTESLLGINYNPTK